MYESPQVYKEAEESLATLVIFHDFSDLKLDKYRQKDTARC